MVEKWKALHFCGAFLFYTTPLFTDGGMPLLDNHPPKCNWLMVAVNTIYIHSGVKFSAVKLKAVCLYIGYAFYRPAGNINQLKIVWSIYALNQNSGYIIKRIWKYLNVNRIIGQLHNCSWEGDIITCDIGCN